MKTLVGVMLGSSQPMFLSWGPERTLLYNDAYAEILAAKHPTALGRDFLEVWHEIRTDLVPIVEDAYAGRPVQMDNIELWMERRGYREETHFAFSYTPVRDEAGIVAGFFCPCVEITEQVVAQRRSASERERQARMFEQAPGFITILKGPEHVFDFVNATYRRLFGNRDFVGRTAREVFPDLEGQGFFDLLDKVFTTGERFIARHVSIRLERSLSASPEERILDFIYEPITDEAGQVTGIFCEGHDVTETQRAEAALRESEERLRAIFETARDYAIFTVDAVGRIETWPAGAQEVFGWTAEEAIGEPVDMTFTPEDRAVGAPETERVTARATGYAPDVRWHLRKDGTRVFIDGVTRPLDGRDGSPAGFVKVGQDITERQRAEERLQLAAEAAALGIFDVNFTTGAMEWDARQRELWGIGPDETITDEIFLAGIHPEDRDRVQGVLTEAFNQEGDGLYWAEFRLLPKEGRSERWIAASGRVHFDKQRPVRLVGTVQDISPRKSTEAALRESETRLSRALKVADLGSFVWDLRTDGLNLDERAREIFGFGSGEGLVAQEIFGRIDPAEFPRVHADVLASQRTLSRLDAEYRVLLPDGGWRIVRSISDVIAGPNEKAKRLVGVFDDVTERWHEEARRQALVQLADRVRDLDDPVEIAFAASELLGQMLKVSRVGYASINDEAETLHVERDWTAPGIETLAGTLRLRDYGSFVDSLKRGEQIAISDVRQDQRTADAARALEARSVRSFMNVPVIERGRLVAVFFINEGKVRDWSSQDLALIQEVAGRTRTAVERTRSAAALRDLNATLEERVAERTAELETAHEQLRQSQKLEAMGQLTGGVAHDFNNLLTPIIASLDMLLRRGVGSERERRLMDGALQSAERAKVLVQRLLAFARRQPLQPGPVDVKHLVGNMAKLVASTLGPRIDVRVDLPDDLPPALADANQLEMAVLNLAVNARDAMPDAGVLSISAVRESVRGRHAANLRPGHYVRLSVQDTGAGMDQATLARAVEPFFSTKGVGKGTGLGLSMVHGLASQLGGGLTITSSPGKGTTVDLWLPISAMAVKEDGQVLDITKAASKSQGTALLVDDEDLVRMSTADMLMDLGYKVVEAQSAEEALRMVGEGLAPDLVVTDHLMPGLSGLDLARDLRSRQPDLPVLIVSGYAEIDGIAPGFPRLTKPFRHAELAASLVALKPSGAL